MNRITLALAILALWAPVSFAQSEVGQQFTLHSEVMGEDRDYWVSLPASYQDTVYSPQSYPVLYITDGVAYLRSVSGIVHFMSSEDVYTFQIPELIVVGLVHPNRTRDLIPTHSLVGQDGQENPAFAETGGGEKFLQFIHDELIPHIDESYRTLPFRILMGHSTGGLLALHDLVGDRNGFQAHIAIDPSLWWDDRATLEKTRRRMADGWGKKSLVYISAAYPKPVEGYDVAGHFEAIKAFGALMAEDPDQVISRYEYFPDEEHDTVALPSFSKGLQFVFEGYRPDFYGFLEDPAKMTAQYEELSERLGMEMLPAESMVDMLGGWAAGSGLEENARTFFRLNTVNYPDSKHAARALEAFTSR